jgi:hypothetical protein
MTIAKLENDDVAEVITAAVKGQSGSFSSLIYSLLGHNGTILAELRKRRIIKWRFCELVRFHSFSERVSARRWMRAHAQCIAGVRSATWKWRLPQSGRMSEARAERRR